MSRSAPGLGVVGRAALACLFSGLCVVAVAQTQASPPAAPAANTGLVYQSAFANYKRHEETAVSSWREANDEVGRIGGWRAYAKEARQPEPARTPSAPAGAGKP